MITYPDRPKLDYGYFVKRPPLGEGLKRLEKLSAWEPKVYSYVFHNCQTDKEINTEQQEFDLWRNTILNTSNKISCFDPLPLCEKRWQFKTLVLIRFGGIFGYAC